MRLACSSQGADLVDPAQSSSKYIYLTRLAVTKYVYTMSNIVKIVLDAESGRGFLFFAIYSSTMKVYIDLQSIRCRHQLA